MAELAAIRQALVRLGFTNEAAAFIVEDQGMTSLDELRLLSDEDVGVLCKVTRRPGGMMNVPGAVAAAGAVPQQMANPGIPVAQRAENNLKLACYFLRFKERTSRAVTPADITLASVRDLREYQEWEKQYEDPEAPELSKDWPRNMENLREYLRGCLGTTKIPLAYVIRADIQVPAADPAEGYDSNQAELIARAPIMDGNNYVQTYLRDREKVWELISDITREMDCWTYVRPAQRNRDGRLAFNNLYGHYLGVNNVDNMATQAEAKLTATTYNGEKRRWNFEKYVKLQVDQFTILEDLVQYGYAGIDERSKVRFLMNGIKTKDFDSVKTRIMSDETLRTDYDACVNLFKDYLAQNPTLRHTPNVQIADMNQTPAGGDGGGGGGGGNDLPDMTVEDRYYTKQEYMKLTSAQKHGLKIKRQKRGHKGGKTTKNGTQKMSLDKRTIKAIATEMTKLDNKRDREEDDSDDDSSDSEEESPSPKKGKKGGNRHNKNLIRNKRK